MLDHIIIKHAVKVLLFVWYKFSWLIKTTKFNNQQDKKIHKNKITYKARIT